MKNKIFPLYFLQFFINASSAAYLSTDVIFYIKNGFNFKQINSLDIVFMVTVFLFEIPTGLFADRISNKFSVGMGVLIRFLTLCFLGHANSITSFLLGFGFLAIGETFLSGAQDVWIVHESEKNKVPLEDAFTKLSYFSYAGSITGGLVGAYLANIQNSNIWSLSALLALMALITFLFCSEFKYNINWKIKNRSNFSYKSLKSYYDQTASHYKQGIIESINIIKKNHLLRNIILYDAFSQFGMTATVRIWQPYFKELFHFESIVYLGIIYALFSFIGILSSLFGNILSSLSRENKIFYAGLFAGLLLLLVLWVKTAIWILVFFFIHVFFQMIKIPLVKSIIHEETPVKNRATMSSFSSCFGTVIESFGFLFFGILLDESGIKVSLFIASLFFIGSAFYYFYKLKNLERSYE